MKTKRFFLFGLPAVLLALGLVLAASLTLAGCGGDDDDDGGVTVPTDLQGDWLRTSPSTYYLRIAADKLDARSSGFDDPSWSIVSCDTSTLEYSIPLMAGPLSFTWVLSNEGAPLTISESTDYSSWDGTYTKQ
ncbi:MAG: hypothetical protein LBK61_13840 [Spirochaetaceae bacterium]|jgi:hypothetical protein|nr:hypothetical protein [Spirochaetaceae bacterium]